jgi:endogenous inhibitor of DNA gyrase (YacG/DUF329 family)
MSERTPKSRCSICGAPVDPALRPFCSKRCADIDLSRWLTGSYAVAGGDTDADEDGDDTLAARGEHNDDVPPDKLH